jgi:uncharacterized protein YfaT (DUF1175 family)
VAVLAVLAVAATVCAFTVHRVWAPAELVTQLAENTLPADGFSATQLTVHASNGRELCGLQVQLETPHQLNVDSVIVRGDLATVAVQSGVMPGEARLRITAAGFAPRTVELQTTSDFGDAVGDGTPDFLRLHDPADRLAFRRWFTLLAESQYYRGKNAAPEIVDCAALLRFAYREALRSHDAEWAHAVALAAPASAGDIRQYRYPYTPLGSTLFRVRDGRFAADDLHDGAFAEFADASTLWRRNTFFVGRSLTRARPGDLLFFRQDTASRMSFHAMIYLGRSQVDPGSEQFVVYHTGPTARGANRGRDADVSGSSQGEIKRLSVAELLNYPDARWRPLASNPAFLGVYRWNILRGAE